MVTEIILKLACPSDIFTNGLIPISNKVYFEYSYLKSEFQGPYYIPVYPSDNEIKNFTEAVFFSAQQYYVPTHEEAEGCIKKMVKMRLATPEDFKISNSGLRENYSYYLTDKGIFFGPFTIMKKSNPLDLKNYLDNNRAYVIDYPSAQRLFINNKKAS